MAGPKSGARRKRGPAGPSQDLLHAVRLHQAGNLGEAAARYRSILAHDPDNADALRLLGVIEAQAGNSQAALDLMTRAVELAPGDPEAHYNLGKLLLVLGRHEAAAAALREAASIRPGHLDTHIDLGLCLKGLGRPAEAEQALRRALDLDPGHPVALNNLGALLLELGRLPEAAAPLERAAAAAPRYARAHFNLGKLRSAEGDAEGAEAAYRRAFDLEPRFPDPLVSLAVLKAERGAYEEALALNERALRLAPRQAPEIRYNMSRSLRRLMRPDDGLAHLALALEQRPDYAQARIYRARLLMDLGRLAEAEREVLDVLRADPACAAAYFALSEVKVFAPNDPVIAAMERLLEETGLDQDDRIHLRFALAKALDDAGDAHAAFRHLREGNRLKFGTLVYDPDAVSKAGAATLERYAVASPREGEGPPGGPVPIFVVGMPRSGTTLVEQLLAAHPDVTGCGELPFIEALAGRAARIPEADAAAYRALGEEYLRRVRERFGVATACFTDKLPANFWHVGLIRRALPGARIIHCARSPMDTAFACYRCLFADGLPWAYDFEALAHYYGVYARMMSAWHEAFPGEILDVAYERLVADLEPNARRLLAFCGLEWADSCLSFHRNANPVTTASNVQVRQPVHTRSVGRWRRYEAHLAPLRRALERHGVAEPGG